MRIEKKMNKFLSDDGYKILYDDGDMYSLYKIHDRIIEIVHNSHYGDDNNTVFVDVDDLREMLSEVDKNVN